MRITFHGAAGTVTGSMHELEVDNRRYLLDCGLYQGRRKEAERRNRTLDVPAHSIDAVVLSHAHIDHTGRLPLLVKQGFTGPIFTTPATIDLCQSMLRDTAHIQESDAEFVNRHHPDEEAVEPLYDTSDAEATMDHFRPVAYRTPTGIASGLTMESFDAGHMLGSSAVVLEHRGVRLAFSGDVGRPGLPIIRDPEPLPPCDYLIMESTYGGRLHPHDDEAIGKLEAVVNETIGRGGRLIVPAFAVGRTQQLVLLLHKLIDANRIPVVPIFVDSPLAVNVTTAFRAHPECFDEEARQFLEQGRDPFGFHRLIYIRDAAESKKLNDLHKPCIIISPAGMCEAGRVLHHLRNGVGNPRNTVLITGYQAEHTLGRKLKDGLKQVKIFGMPVEVRAQVESLDELSGHADSEELLTWMKPITPRLKHVFLVHGEPEQSQALAGKIRARYGIEVTVPGPGASFPLHM